MAGARSVVLCENVICFEHMFIYNVRLCTSDYLFVLVIILHTIGTKQPHQFAMSHGSCLGAKAHVFFVCQPYPRFEVAASLKMGYNKQQQMVDDICASLQTRDFPDDDNPYHKTMNAKGEKLYYLQKLDMGTFNTKKAFYQTLQSNVSRTDRRNWAALEGSNPGIAVETTAQANLKLKVKAIDAAEPRLAALLKDFKQLKARMSLHTAKEGVLFKTYINRFVFFFDDNKIHFKKNQEIKFSRYFFSLDLFASNYFF